MQGMCCSLPGVLHRGARSSDFGGAFQTAPPAGQSLLWRHSSRKISCGAHDDATEDALQKIAVPGPHADAVDVQHEVLALGARSPSPFPGPNANSQLIGLE